MDEQTTPLDSFITASNKIKIMLEYQSRGRIVVKSSEIVETLNILTEIGFNDFRLVYYSSNQEEDLWSISRMY